MAIRESVDRASNVIQDLGNQSNAIGKILTVIDEVADQTSLLSLNAAIIAAQAGEHGNRITSYNVCYTKLLRFPDLVGHDGKALAMLAGLGGDDGGIQGEQTGLVGDVVDDGKNLADGARLVAEVRNNFV